MRPTARSTTASATNDLLTRALLQLAAHYADEAGHGCSSALGHSSTVCCGVWWFWFWLQRCQSGSSPRASSVSGSPGGGSSPGGGPKPLGNNAGIGSHLAP